MMKPTIELLDTHDLFASADDGDLMEVGRAEGISTSYLVFATEDARYFGVPDLPIHDSRPEKTEVQIWFATSPEEVYEAFRAAMHWATEAAISEMKAD